MNAHATPGFGSGPRGIGSGEDALRYENQYLSISMSKKQPFSAQHEIERISARRPYGVTDNTDSCVSLGNNAHASHDLAFLVLHSTSLPLVSL